jgi:hypothetical protein
MHASLGSENGSSTETLGRLPIVFSLQCPWPREDRIPKWVRNCGDSSIDTQKLQRESTCGCYNKYKTSRLGEM